MRSWDRPNFHLGKRGLDGAGLLHDLWPTGHTAGSDGGARQSQEAQLGAPFKPSSNAQLHPIRILELTKSIIKIKGDEALAAADKEAEIRKLEDRKAEFEKLMVEVPQT